jgi:hypothetical protein
MSESNFTGLLKPQQVVVTVAPDGSTSLDFVGFVGKSCLSEDNHIRNGLAQLGILITDTHFIAKPELALELEPEAQAEAADTGTGTGTGTQRATEITA